MSALTATYGLLVSPYLTPAVNFSVFSLNTSTHPAAHRCSTGALWRAFWQGVQQLTGHKLSVHILIVLRAVWHTGHCHCEVFSAPYDHCQSAVLSAPYGHCHSALFSAPYGHCHSAPYRRSPVVKNIPGCWTAYVKTMQQPVTPAISTQCSTQDATVNVNCH